MSVFSLGKRILDKYPRFINTAAFLYNLISFNSIKINHNKIMNSTAFMKRCKIRIKGNGNEIVFGQKCVLSHCNIVITGNNNKIVLGDSIYADKCTFCIEDSGNLITLNDDTRIFGPCEFAAMEGTKIELGKGCLISSNTVFRTGDSHSLLDLNGNRINPSQAIVIGNRVWLGQRAVVLKGATIADDSIVSFGAVVTKKFVEGNAILAGVPARVVKTDIKWCKERIEVRSKKSWLI